MASQKLVATSDSSDIYTTFTGSTRLKAGINPSGAYMDMPDNGPALTRSATTPAPSAPPDDQLMIDTDHSLYRERSR